jgi:hypothetical protein
MKHLRRVSGSGIVSSLHKLVLCRIGKTGDRREQFLSEAGHSKSKATRYLYDRALTRLEQ